MADADELGKVQKRVQDAIDMAWTHLGQVSALQREVDILEGMQIRDTDGLYEHAKKLIPFFKLRERLVKAMSDMDYEELRLTLRDIEQSPESEEYQKWLELELPRAKRQFKQMSARLQMKNKKRDLNQTCVTEIRRFNNPQYLLHQVMMAVFALLGYSQSKIKKWDFIQKEMGKPGREGTLFKIQSCRVSEIPERQVFLAHGILAQIDEEGVKNLTSSATAFYDWANKKLRLADKYRKGEDVTEEEQSSTLATTRSTTTASSTARRERSQESRPITAATSVVGKNKQHNKESMSSSKDGLGRAVSGDLFEDESVKELIDSEPCDKQPITRASSARPSTGQSSTAVPLEYNLSSVHTIINQSRPRTAVSVTRSRPTTSQNERGGALEEPEKEQFYPAVGAKIVEPPTTSETKKPTSKKGKRSNSENTSPSRSTKPTEKIVEITESKHDADKKRSKTSQSHRRKDDQSPTKEKKVAKSSDTNIENPSIRTAESDQNVPENRPATQPEKRQQSEFERIGSSSMKKSRITSASTDSGRSDSARKGSALLRVVLSDDVDQVDIDEVDEITERRKQQERAHSTRSLEKRQTTQQSIISTNMLAPPQFEHEKLIEKLDILAEEQSSESRHGGMPPPTPIVIPPTPLLERGESSHSLNSNNSEKENQQRTNRPSQAIDRKPFRQAIDRKT
ncbi:uncharacterized protein LOC142347847 isoform X2 [Convolutriloba macropyga]|uniref:uncharacterized protein LOC142347847 isoform X2 n=1 Tax=Convolutriloba macropyga TaxID=536237 RepID=UPI003F51F190